MFRQIRQHHRVSSKGQTMASRRDWAHAFLVEGQHPSTVDNVLAVLTWIRSEFGGRAPIPAGWNPLATTYDLDPNSEYNDAGVRNFETFAQGVRANVLTLNLNEPGYQRIRDSLANGDTPDAVVEAIHASAWGSKPTLDELAYVRAHEPNEGLLAVGDGGESPHPLPAPAGPPYEGTLLVDRTQGHGTRLWQAKMAQRGWSIEVDDIYGPQSARVCSAFQHEKGLDVDGIVGPVTWHATWTAPITR